MIIGKLDMIADNTPLSDPHMYDIRDVRAVAKKRAKLYKYAPHAIYIKSIKKRQYHRIFENGNFGRSRLDECGRLCLTSFKRPK